MKRLAKLLTTYTSVSTLQSFFIGISLLFLGFTVGRILLQFQLFDFNIYYQASQDILAKKPLYQNPLIDNNYPPSAFLFTVPFTAFDQETAERLWTLLSLSLLISSIVITLKAIDRHSLKRVLLVLSVASWTFPIKFAFGLGQINFLILFFYALSFWASVKRQPLAAGFWLGLAASIKLTPLLLVVFFWKKRQWSAGLMTILSFLCLQLVALWAFSPMNTLHYLMNVLPHIPTVGNAAYYNQAWTGLLARLNVPAHLAWWLNYTTFGLVLFKLWQTIKPQETTPVRQLTEFGSLITLSLLGAGLAWQHHFIWLLLPIVGLYYLNQSRQISWKLLLLISICLIGSNSKHPETYQTWPLILSHVSLGSSVLLYLLIKELESFSIFHFMNRPHGSDRPIPKKGLANNARL